MIPTIEYSIPSNPIIPTTEYSDPPNLIILTIEYPIVNLPDPCIHGMNIWSVICLTPAYTD